MASETTMQTSCIQEDPEVDECRENIPPEDTTQPSGENKPLSDSCTFSTPAPASSNGVVKAKSRLSGLQSALTPIYKYLNIGNKSPSREPLKCGNSPHLSVPFASSVNCQKSVGVSSQPPNSDSSSASSGRSLGDKNAPVCWLDDEYLPEITLLDVTCDSTMQMTRNDSALPDSVPATPVTARSVTSTFSTLQPPHLNSSTDVIITAHKSCPQNKPMDPLQSNVSSPKAEREATDQTCSVSKNTTETSFVMNQNCSADKTGGSCDVQDATFDSVQKSSGSAILGEAGDRAFCLQNSTFDSKPSSKQNGTITLSETSTSASHQSAMDKPSPSKICNVLTSAKENNSEVHPPELSKHCGTTSGTDPNAKMADTPESMDAPVRWLDDRYFPDITLLEVTRDSELSPGAEISSMEVTQDIPPMHCVTKSRPSSELSGQIAAEPGRLDVIQSEELSGTLTGSVTHTISSFSEQSDKCVGENIMKASLEVTRDISMGSVLENSRSSLETSGQNLVKSQTSAEDTLSTHPANVTRDIISSSNMSVQCAASEFSTSDVQRNTSLKNVTSELHVTDVETSATVEANNEEVLTSHDAELTNKAPQSNPKTTVSANGTFTIAQPSNLSTSTDLNTTAQISCPQNKTLDLPPSNVNSPKAGNEVTNQVSADCEDTAEPSLSTNQNCSSVKATGSSDVQSTTFDKQSPQESSACTNLGEAGATTFCLQNNTFDSSKPPSKQNGTITLSETSSSDSHQKTLDKPSPSKACSPLSSSKDNNSEVHPPELSKQNGTTTSTDSNTKVADSPESTFEANPASEAASGAGRHETKDHSQSGQSATDGLSDTLGHPGMDTENNKANTFNLDDTLDLRVDSLVTSTPMTNCKVFHFSMERDEGKTIGAQKKLYGDGSSKPGQPSNIVSDRKTFFTQPVVKSLLPHSKAASQLLKFKPASTLPGRCEPLTSGLPMTRQRTQAEALKNAAAPDAAQGTQGISSSYNLRASTTGSKQPSSGLPRPHLSGIPSGIQRTAPGLRAPSTRSIAPTSDKLRGATATNPVTKTSQAKKHTLTRGEPLPTAKRKKIDVPLPSNSAEASTSSCDAVNRAKNLKQPTTGQRALPAKTQRDDGAVPASTAENSASCDAASRARALKQPTNSHRPLLAKPQGNGNGCAKCVALEEQLKIKSEEIRRLKEELLKYRKQGEEC
ncbi:flocculation protein FLO11-like [Toxotes jaculatrix]|uniref:flocculation protein FLO11-like n=1 Tax=Toxotes jaculatrix TaxID=941984 RepID=UPI001B3B024A|nr:flocculation protein FLO11-like [Toxotes jaculatrix]